ncbi:MULTISPECIES: HNH endonuclease signature motif containing protein [unclassified Streptomyces]|uniref:HNH endonuclease signature motif containing protein n=1 Tax=unclassified Streptomyces TaxID=2593676 RepID=UPI0033DC6B34
MPSDAVRLAFLKAVHPRGKVKSPDMVVVRRYPFGQLRVALGDGLATVIQFKQVFNSVTSQEVAGDGRPVIVLAFKDSAVGRQAFSATREPSARRALEGRGGNTVRWNAKTRTLSVICPDGFVINKAYSPRVRSWTTESLIWFQKVLDEQLPSRIAAAPPPAAGPAAPGPGKGEPAAAGRPVRSPAAALADSEDTPARGYRAIVAELEDLLGRSAGHRQVAANRRQRSLRARTAVILRSDGRCENPGCASPLFREVTATGEAILEVDHVQDLALGGADHPLNMVALCPNCHAVKTRGRNAEALREALTKVARDRHSEAWQRLTR